ncbi:glutamine amidotransferase [Microbacterium sp. ABRD28]|uniref:glutamine amidotransferase n=1 Tax=Microbacterium sp. ABRD28 TaxID=2268461 RepID=UPI000F55888D|nr:glutamine amidotransferase [Microbacterium sp. ABRD28]AZC12344.1 cytoplasmic protein [Microbacterium sp. ABRD28]
MKKALLLGESWMTHMIHQKGFDSFTTTEYVEGGKEFIAALESDGWQVDHLPAHAIESNFPATDAELGAYDLIVISDVGANTFLLTRAVFTRSESERNRLARLRDYVERGGGLLMVGGYLSFSGIDAKAHYGETDIGDILPVGVLPVDDRQERPEGAKITVLDDAHSALGGVGGAWPDLLGYNRTTPRADSQVLVEVNGDPLVAVRDVGAGRTGVFTSDMSPHWAPPEFMAWDGYAPLWRGLAAWTAGD